LLRGEVGSGKTTLLQWLAVSSARGSFSGSLSEWNDTIPFFIELRRYADSELPQPEAFVRYMAGSIAGEMPSGWVHRQLKSGRALVLIDGVDEVPQADRRKALLWLTDLVENFPQVRYVVTSRPPAVKEGWLENQFFMESYLQPMTLADIDGFVDHWHEAAGENLTGEEARAELRELSTRLKATIRDNPPVRNLARSPLLCAMLCALHRDRKAKLPRERLELYRIALETLLERRDPERDIRLPEGLNLGYAEKELLLQDFAFWLLVNGKSDTEESALIERIERRLNSMPRTEAPADVVFQYLLLRSGLLRVPVEGRVDFVHRTFQEYLAAKELVEQDDIGLLLKQARSDQWSEVIVLAAGLGNQRQRETLVGGLLQRGNEQATARGRLHLLAVACLETVPSLSDELRTELRRALEALIPPRKMRDARALASAGDLAVPMLRGHGDKGAAVVAACVRALALIGTPDCLPVLQEYARDERVTVAREVVRAWSSFNPKEFAAKVLANAPLNRGVLALSDVSLLPFVGQLNRLSELHCIFGDRLPKLTALNAAPKLTHLDLSRNTAISDLSPLVRHGELRSLKLGNCSEITNITPLGGLQKLQALDLSGCPVDDLGPLGNLTNLICLDLVGMAVADLAPLRTLEGLQELYLTGSQTIADVTPLSGMTSLKRLSLAGCIGVDNLSALGQLPDLEFLDAAALPRLQDLFPLKGLSRLKYLILSNSSGIVDLSPLQELPHLMDLNLSYVTGLRNLRALGALGRLQKLHLAGVQAASDLSQIAKLTKLGVLDLREVPGLSDLSPLASLADLTILLLDGCMGITDLSPLGELKSLRFLSLRGCQPDLSPPAGLEEVVVVR
jgi:Leucine-rich repeat (LRR) protein